MSGQTRVLTVGSHVFDFSPSPDSTGCCDPVSYSWKVEPDDGSGNPQLFHGSLRFHPATVTLQGAPPDGRLSCLPRGVNLLGNGSTTVAMNSPNESLYCSLIPLGTHTIVVLSAGQEFVVRWTP